MSLGEPKQIYSWFRRISSQFISDKDFEKLERTSVNLNFKKGETILKQGGIPTHIVYLEKGIVKFNYENETGKNLILTIVSAPKFWVEPTCFIRTITCFRSSRLKIARLS